MSGAELFTTIGLPIGLGLFAFIEPCSIGSALLFIKLMQDRPPAVRLAQVATFSLTRASLVGLLGAMAALLGSAFFSLQKTGWVVLGLTYLAVGLLYLTGHAGLLMRTLGPPVGRLGDLRASAALGLLFGLNIPACAAPLLLVLLAGSASGATHGVAGGFVSLALFGLALSLPFAVAVLFERGRRALDWIAGLANRIPRWTGVSLVALGLWSIWFGLFVNLT